MTESTVNYSEVCVYIYIYIERERERENALSFKAYLGLGVSGYKDV